MNDMIENNDNNDSDESDDTNDSDDNNKPVPQDDVEPIWATAARHDVTFATYLWGRLVMMIMMIGMMMMVMMMMKM